MNDSYLKGPQGTPAANRQEAVPAKIKYCLYSRKSTESEERQVLSIDSQIKEMLRLAEREGLEVAEIRRESHSAKDTGKRPVFNELLEDIRRGRFNGILTWAPDRLSRNAGDLGALVDLMDQKLLAEIRTNGQRFTDSPSEKFLLMILGSQAKLENDNRGVNVKRGLKTRVEMGLWPGVAPLGYLNQYTMDKKCQLVIDPQRAPVVKRIFEKVAEEKWSGQQVYNWLRHELNFRTRGDKHVALSGIFRMLATPFYYGMYEYPKKSGNWYQGKHEPIITKELFERARDQLGREVAVRDRKEFAFTRLISCGACGSAVSAEEKFKPLKGGGTARYVYYGCNRGKDRSCKNNYIREEDLIEQLIGIMDKIDLNELGVRVKFEEEIERFNKFQKIAFGKTGSATAKKSEIDVRTYVKYLLREGSMLEKRELLSNLRSKLTYRERTLTLS